MPLDYPDQKHFESACGYMQLGMVSEGNDSLEQISAQNRVAPEVLALRVEIYRHFKKWDLMLEISKRLHEFQPNKIQWLISYAFASRRALSIEVAKEILLKSVSKFPKEAVIHFNLGCYYSVTGELNVAKEYLREAFEIDPSWRLEALEDKDLEPIWGAIREGG